MYMKNSNDPYTIITQALEEMKIESGSRFSVQQGEPC